MQYLACPGEFWMLFNEPTSPVSPSLDFLHKVEQGNLIDRLAEQWFQIHWESHSMGNEGTLHFQKVAKTKDFYAKMDVAILAKDGKHIQLFEVKASTGVKTEHLYDVAFQRMVFQKAGYTVTDTFLVHVNKDYRTNLEESIANLLKVVNISAEVNEIELMIEKEAVNALQTLHGVEPTPSLTHLCGNKLNCPFIQKYHTDLPAYNVTNIARIGKKKLGQLLEADIIDILDVPEDFRLSAKQRQQVNVAQTQVPIIKPKPIQKALDELEYPLYFLDYESFSYVLPVQAGFAPYQQMVFQYSLHTIATPDAEVRHTEYLLNSKTESLENLLESMRQDMNTDGGTVIVWNKSFECSRNKEMAELYPEYADFLLAMNDKVFDLMEIFSKSLYVHPDFKGKASLKSVLPVLCPELSYQELPIGNGMMATIKWHHMTSEGEMTGEEQVATRRDLLRYCALDTWAMVRILEEVRKEIE
jgi:hypothetical protein